MATVRFSGSNQVPVEQNTFEIGDSYGSSGGVLGAQYDYFATVSDKLQATVSLDTPSPGGTPYHYVGVSLWIDDLIELVGPAPDEGPDHVVAKFRVTGDATVEGQGPPGTGAAIIQYEALARIYGNISSAAGSYGLEEWLLLDRNDGTYANERENIGGEFTALIPLNENGYGTFRANLVLQVNAFAGFNATLDSLHSFSLTSVTLPDGSTAESHGWTVNTGVFRATADAAQTPEPASMALLAMGGGLLAFGRKRLGRRQKTADLTA
jgi:hypothetical protein